MTLYAARHKGWYDSTWTEWEKATDDEVLLEAIERGLIRREWSCGSDKSECSPEDTDRGYLHAGCHWHYFLWTVEQDKIEELYQKAEG